MTRSTGLMGCLILYVLVSGCCQSHVVRCSHVQASHKIHKTLPSPQWCQLTDSSCQHWPGRLIHSFVVSFCFFVLKKKKTGFLSATVVTGQFTTRRHIQPLSNSKFILDLDLVTEVFIAGGASLCMIKVYILLIHVIHFCGCVSHWVSIY